MNTALATTAKDLGSALTMRPRRAPVPQLVETVFTELAGPIPEGVHGRRVRKHLRQIGVWAMREINCTDAEIGRQYGADEMRIIFDAGDVERRRNQDDAYRQLTDAVRARMED